MQTSATPESDTDAIDSLLGLASNMPIHALRRTRPEFVSGTQACEAAVLRPENDLGLAPTLRQALAARMARLLELPDLAAYFLDRTPDESMDPDVLPIARGDAADSLPQLYGVLARHCDTITLNPRQASRADIETLAEAGVTTPQIVALSELVAFVNFHARVIVSFNLLKSDK